MNKVSEQIAEIRKELLGKRNTVKRLAIITAAVLLILTGLFSVLPEITNIRNKEYAISDSNGEHFEQLFSDLLKACQQPSSEDSQAILTDLNAIRSVSEKDYALASSIANHWQKVYLDPEYHLCMYPEESISSGPENKDIPNTSKHAFIVLGYELQNGEMTDELKGRCEAAAAAAKSFPYSVLVCTGGATGGNNPEHHTEAGLMKQYLTEQCGIREERIYIDEKAMTTAENAVNTFEILRENGIKTMTIITSSYHQRWGQVLYNGLGAMYEQKYGNAPKLVGNYSYRIEPDNSAYLNDAGIAIRQLASVLKVPRNSMAQ